MRLPTCCFPCFFWPATCSPRTPVFPASACRSPVPVAAPRLPLLTALPAALPRSTPSLAAPLCPLHSLSFYPFSPASCCVLTAIVCDLDSPKQASSSGEEGRRDGTQGVSTRGRQRQHLRPGQSGARVAPLSRGFSDLADHLRSLSSACIRPRAACCASARAREELPLFMCASCARLPRFSSRSQSLHGKLEPRPSRVYR